jgi:uncharacterized membrane protein
MTSIKSGVSFAAAAAILALSAATPVIAKEAKAETVHCFGVNSCKGTSDCKTSTNDCKGMNVCKGHGFKEMTSQACTAAGGTLTEAK